MKDLLGGFVLVMIVGLIFVRSGQNGGESGGAQAARIISSTGAAVSSTIKSLYGN